MMEKVAKIAAYLIVLGSVFLLSCKKESDDIDYSVEDKRRIKAYIQTNNLDADSTSSGLYYVIDKSGVGQNPNKYSTVKVRYKGYLLSGEVFDQNTAGAIFSLNSVISGWQEGIPKFKEGGAGKLLIPSHLGYGSRSTGSIPANSVLIFDINLDEVIQ